MLEKTLKLGTTLTKTELQTIKGARTNPDGGVSVGCANGVEFNIRNKSDRTAKELCSSNGGVAYMVLLP